MRCKRTKPLAGLTRMRAYDKALGDALNGLDRALELHQGDAGEYWELVRTIQAVQRLYSEASKAIDAA